MDRVAFFVDLPNLYSGLIRSKILEDPTLLRSYFVDWFNLGDLNLVSGDPSNRPIGIWGFYSKLHLGPARARILDRDFKKYINRTNRLPAVTLYDVDIPGSQREPVEVTCPNCDQLVKTESMSEKGIDSSLTVYLFDTMDAWDKAILVSGDADFVPVVKALRRRGKIVIGAGFEDASTALVRECYSYDNIGGFLREDIGAYLLFKEDGIIDKWLLNDMYPSPEYVPIEQVRLQVSLETYPLIRVNFIAYSAAIDFSEREKLFDPVSSLLAVKHDKEQMLRTTVMFTEYSSIGSGISRRYPSKTHLEVVHEYVPTTNSYQIVQGK